MRARQVSLILNKIKLLNFFFISAFFCQITSWHCNKVIPPNVFDIPASFLKYILNFRKKSQKTIKKSDFWRKKFSVDQNRKIKIFFSAAFCVWMIFSNAIKMVKQVSRICDEFFTLLCVIVKKSKKARHRVLKKKLEGPYSVSRKPSAGYFYAPASYFWFSM